jgi:hypothetical protein
LHSRTSFAASAQDRFWPFAAVIRRMGGAKRNPSLWGDRGSKAMGFTSFKPSYGLEAAGIDSKGTPEWVRQVTFAVRKGGKETKNSSQLVGYLNSRNIMNARGYPWTHAALQAFIRHYIPLRRQP